MGHVSMKADIIKSVSTDLIRAASGDNPDLRSHRVQEKG